MRQSDEDGRLEVLAGLKKFSLSAGMLLLLSLEVKQRKAIQCPQVYVSHSAGGNCKKDKICKVSKNY